MKKVFYFIIIILILSFATVTVIAIDLKLDYEHNLDNVHRPDYYDLYNRRLFIPEFNVRGIYVSGWVAGTNDKMNHLINMVDRTVLNTMVIDIKDQQGYLSYTSNVPLAKKIGASRNKIKDIRTLLARLHSRGIYVIGRIVVFKDSTLATKCPEYALKLRTEEKGEYRSQSWVFPGHEEVCNYNIEIAGEAINLGFDEIQFDYIRFPALARKPEKVVIERENMKSELIVEFLQKARKNLARYNIPLSIDVYGLTTSTRDDMGIGQDFARLSNYTDIISPMVYPSHYAPGCYGIEIPDLEPYNTVYRSIYDAKRKVKDNNKIQIRPWLQDFSLQYSYTVADVKAQIRAVEEQGIKEWLLWNPGSQYTEEALTPAYKINFHFE